MAVLIFLLRHPVVPGWTTEPDHAGQFDTAAMPPYRFPDKASPESLAVATGKAQQAPVVVPYQTAARPLASSHTVAVTGVYSLYAPYIVRQESIGWLDNNGDFELGAVMWHEYSTHNQQLILPSSNLGVAPHSGDWAVRLGNTDDEVSIVSQGVTISDAAACLVFWQWVVSSDVCAVDFGGVGINGNWVDVSSLCAGTSTAKWVRRQVNLQAYSTTVTSTLTVLNFAATTDYSDPSTMYVDDVWLYPTGVCNAARQSEQDAGHTDHPRVTMLIGQPITSSLQSSMELK